MRPRLLFLVLLIAGCSGLGPKDGPAFAPIAPVPGDKAIVYVFYPAKPHMINQWAEVSLNFEKKFDLGYLGYGVFSLPPGKYEITVEGDKWKTNWGALPVTRTLEVESGREYFLRVSMVPKVSGRFGLVTEITLVAKDQALEEMAETRLHHSGVLGAGSDAPLDPKAVNEAKRRVSEQRRIQEYSSRCADMGYDWRTDAYRDCFRKLVDEAAEPYLARCESLGHEKGSEASRACARKLRSEDVDAR